MMSMVYRSLEARVIVLKRSRTIIHQPHVSDSCKRFLGQQWGDSKNEERPIWSEEWRRLNLGATLVDGLFPSNLFFVQLGFGVDQHGDRSNATKAAVRAVRNAIEFNSIPGVIEHIPGGRKEMIIHVKLGVPSSSLSSVNFMEVAKVFPYGKILPIEVTTGGLEFATGRIVEELGDQDDIGVCAVACVSIGYNKETEDENNNPTSHKVFSTKEGY